MFLLPAVPEKSPPELSDMMQADGPRACRFGRQWYMNNESWHPTVPPFGEMKCITCWCVVSAWDRPPAPPASLHGHKPRNSLSEPLGEPEAPCCEGGREFCH